MRHVGLARPNGRLAALIGGAATLAGCAAHKLPAPDVQSAPPPRPAVTAPVAPPLMVATPGLTPRARYQLALSSLAEGQTDRARVELEQLGRDEPNNRRTQLLLRQIQTDPKQLYGGDSFAYTVQVGDTLFSLARKYLHDPLNFYGLARFNNLKLPVDLQPGSQIFIPGHPRAPTVRKQRAPVASGKVVAPVVAAPAAPLPAAADHDAAERDRAQALRRQGLEQMSAGSIDRAVTLLSQAATLDPQNSAIGSDLARARRIQATVHSR